MALAGTGEGGRLPGATWDWRAERGVVLRGLRSGYPYLLALVAALAVTLAYQFAPATGVVLGGGYDAPYVRGFHERDERQVTASGRPFRWATDRARVLLPGVGARPATLVVAAAARPDGAPQPVQVAVNGIALGQFTPAAELGEHRFALAPAHYSYGDLTVDLLSAPQQVRGKNNAPLPYGPRVAAVRVEPAGPAAALGGGGFVKPALRPLAAWLAIAPLLYVLLLRLGLRPPAALGVGLAAVAAGAAGLAVQRLDLVLFAPRLAGLLALAWVLLVGADLLAPRLFAHGGVTVDARTWRLLQLIFLLAFTLKLGGIAYPQFNTVDLPWHAQQFEKVLRGRFLEIYRPGAEGISTLPDHWRIQAQLPYSPFLYLFGLPFYLWPVGKALSIGLWAGLLDVGRVFLVFYLARRLGARARAAIIAAFVVAMTASTFLLHSWGNYPTMVSQWCAFLFLTLLAANFGSLRRPPVFLGLLALLTLTMLLYTVTAVFIGTLLVAIMAALRWHGAPEERRGVAPLAAILAGASALAFLGYYVQYAGPLLAQTLPAFRGELGQGDALGIPRDPLPAYLRRYAGNLVAYGVVISFLLAPFGARLLLRATANRLAAPLLGAWFAVFALFFIAGTRIDMVSKEIWFILPAAAICAGVACDALLRRWQDRRGWGRLGRALVALYLAHLVWGGVTLWLARIIIVRQ